jgi:hypothetical protein
VLETPIVSEIKNLFQNIEEEDDKRKIIFDQQKLTWARVLNIILLITFA